MRVLLIAALATALSSPALAQGFGNSSDSSTTTTQTTTTKTQSGDTTTTTTTTRSETTSQGGGFSFGGMFNSAPRGGGSSYESLGGSWTIGEAAASKTCDLKLDKTKFISSYSARTGIGCPEGLFGVSSWMLAGDEIRLMSPAGSVLAKLHASRSGRWDGTTTAGLDIFMTRQ
jgi:hypothetical protein